MASNTLDGRDRAVLEALRDGTSDIERLASTLEANRDALEERLSRLADNGLVNRGDDGYALTDNGRRVLEATPVDGRDYRIDTPDEVERALESRDLRPDEASAVRAAFSFLRYWGEATAAEVIDAAYSEVPVGYESAERWWSGCVRDHLEALPTVTQSGDEDLGEQWRYEGTPAIDSPEDGDGRDVPDPPSVRHSIGSARHALESLEPSPAERATARAAFVVLAERGRATVDDLLEAIEDGHSTEHESSDGSVEALSSLLLEIPGVSRVGETEGADAAPVLRYEPAPEDIESDRRDSS
ncbi:hypothetical protein [Natronosalvus rutilus]|uniref:HVO-A0261-like N-terminal domain-containing protein n=1 Tax=Natronosalvus rutilus TaxID=2953753 RepID=A0A9E7NC98_9EURY|nr:hypothetical protein [Natronosalvus rutilus]UTF54305.1 hypothetical protein NGM29_03215 [Natronosalvus rutilus]